MLSWVIKARSRRVVQFKDRCTVTVQPAGASGQRRVYVTLSGCAGNGNAPQSIELVLPECAASRLGEALISGSVGIMREFDLNM